MTNTQNQTLSDTDFAKLEIMAKLTLTDEEKKTIKSQLDEALKAVEVLKELDTTNVTPLNHPGNLINVWREDVVNPSLPQEEALQNAKKTHEGFIVVPAIFEETL